MTDKERAKEYVDKLYAEKVNNKDFDKDGRILYQSKDISDAYLAGLKTGKDMAETDLRLLLICKVRNIIDRSGTRSLTVICRKITTRLVRRMCRTKGVGMELLILLGVMVEMLVIALIIKILL